MLVECLFGFHASTSVCNSPRLRFVAHTNSVIITLAPNFASRRDQPSGPVQERTAESLYPSIDQSGALEALRWAIQHFRFVTQPIDNDDLIAACHFVLTNAYCVFEGQLYHQTQGGPMGCFLFPLLADIYMAWWEHHLLALLPEET